MNDKNLIISSFTFLIFVFIFIFRKKIALNYNPLHKQLLFWMSVTVPFLYFVLFILLSDYGELDLFNPSSQLSFIDKAKVPLIILGLAPVFSLFVTNAHRTIQTNKQIESSEEKNKVDLYLAHYKFHADIIGDFKKNIIKNVGVTLMPISKKITYGCFFSGNSMRDGVVLMEPTSFIDKVLELIISSYQSAISTAKINELNALLDRNDGGKARDYGFEIITFHEGLSYNDYSDMVHLNGISIVNAMIFLSIKDLFSSMGLGVFIRGELRSDWNATINENNYETVLNFFDGILSIHSNMGIDFDEAKLKVHLYILVNILKLYSK